jgi:hypothetical protein
MHVIGVDLEGNKSNPRGEGRHSARWRGIGRACSWDMMVEKTTIICSPSAPTTRSIFGVKRDEGTDEIIEPKTSLVFFMAGLSSICFKTNARAQAYVCSSVKKIEKKKKKKYKKKKKMAKPGKKGKKKKRE